MNTMRKIIFGLLLSVAFLFSACSFYLPHDYDEFHDFSVIFLVEPETAQIILNGKFIGEAYEFSTDKSALRISSRNNEITVKKEGYIEEVIDLREYDSRVIKIRLKLLEDGEYTKEVKEEKPVSRRFKPKYKPRPSAEKKPEKKVEIKKDKSDPYIKVILEIEPAESSIYIDGKFWGISPQGKKIGNLRLKPGKYTLEVVKPGYKSYKKELDITGEEDLKLVIDLKK